MLDEIRRFAHRNDIEYTALIEYLALERLRSGDQAEILSEARRRLRERQEQRRRENEQRRKDDGYA